MPVSTISTDRAVNYPSTTASDPQQTTVGKVLNPSKGRLRDVIYPCHYELSLWVTSSDARIGIVCISVPELLYCSSTAGIGLRPSVIFTTGA